VAQPITLRVDGSARRCSSYTRLPAFEHRRSSRRAVISPLLNDPDLAGLVGPYHTFVDPPVDDRRNRRVEMPFRKVTACGPGSG
jgi:hypothetical protein